MDCSNLQRLTRGDIQIGMPLPFSIHDPDGWVLLPKGYVITLPGQIERLVKHGALIGDGDSNPAPPPYAPPPSTAPDQQHASSLPKSKPVHEQMDDLVLDLKHMLATTLKSPDQINLAVNIGRLAGDIQSLCREDLDSALAAPYLDSHNPYLVVHQVMGAILTEIIAGRKGLSVAERRPLICAALTRDIGQIAIQSALDKCDGPLSSALGKAIREHPTRSREILSRAGIADNAWLNTVQQHHERLDGSGYPLKLRENEVGLGGRILAIADTYSAMTKPRSYRGNAHHPQKALRDIYLKKDLHMDGELIQTLIKEIGIMPPGTIVRLKNGEIAVVRNRSAKPSEATVFSVYDSKGMPLFSPVRRETTDPGFGITGTVSFAECRSAAATIRRLWVK